MQIVTNFVKLFILLLNTSSPLLAVDYVHNSSGERASQSLKSEPGEYFLLATRLLGEQNLRGGEQIVARE